MDRDHPRSPCVMPFLIENSPAQFPTHSSVHLHFAYPHALLLFITH